MGDGFGPSEDCASLHLARIWLPERRIMFLRFGAIGFAVLFAAAAAPSTLAAHASVMKPESPGETGRQRQILSPEFQLPETIRVPIWIPGFDDGNPPFGFESGYPESEFVPSCFAPSETKRTAFHFGIDIRLVRLSYVVGISGCGRRLHTLPRIMLPGGSRKEAAAPPVI